MVDTSQVLLGAALVGLGAIAARFVGSTSSSSSPSSTTTPADHAAGSGSGKAKKANKKKRPAPAAATKGLAPPSDASHAASSSVDISRSATPVDPEPPAPTPAAAPAPPVTAATPGKKKKAAAAAAKKEETHPKPLAERKTPKARKTGVEDMLEEDDAAKKPARVIKVVETPSAPKPPPANAYVAPTVDRDDGEWERYVDEDAGWEEVESKSNRNKSASSTMKLPEAVVSPARSIPGLPSTNASSGQAKKNAKKAQAAAEAKAEAERERVQRLAAHRAGRAAEEANERAAAARPKPTSVPATAPPKSSDDYWTQDPRSGTSRQPTAKASVDADTGSLIWG